MIHHDSGNLERLRVVPDCGIQCPNCMKYSVESLLAAIAVLALLFFPKNHEDETKTGVTS